MPDLFADSRSRHLAAAQPLAVRMRPRSLDEFVGQQHFLGPGKLLRRMVEADRLASVLFYGPPGTGKTTLAQIIAATTASHFEPLNAGNATVRDVRAVIDAARDRLETAGARTVLFLDELHRFNKAQQDILLGDVEEGVIVLIGATTENPFFAVNSALVSRSQIFQFTPLSEEEIAALVRRAIADPERGYGNLELKVEEEAIGHWARISDGDARRALAALEIAVLSQREETTRRRGVETKRGRDGETKGPDAEATGVAAGAEAACASAGGGGLHITLAVAEESIQRKALVYDRLGDQHYDHASALIKSMRGSDPDAAVYWLARMLESGEDPRFVARRVAIFASEDVGNADPRAICVAAAAWDLVARIGLPECQLTLSQAVIYMATAPKSRASCTAIGAAVADVREGRTLPVPKKLRDSHYSGARRLGHGQPADGEQADYFGVDARYYEPADSGEERELRPGPAAQAADPPPAQGSVD